MKCRVMRLWPGPAAVRIHVSAFHVLSDRHSALQLQVTRRRSDTPRAARLVSLAVAIMTFHFGCKAVSDAIYAAGNRPKGEVSEGWR